MFLALFVPSACFSLSQWYIILARHKYALKNGYFMPATRQRNIYKPLRIRLSVCLFQFVPVLSLHSLHSLTGLLAYSLTYLLIAI